MSAGLVGLVVILAIWLLMVIISAWWFRKENM